MYVWTGDGEEEEEGVEGGEAVVHLEREMPEAYLPSHVIEHLVAGVTRAPPSSSPSSPSPAAASMHTRSFSGISSQVALSRACAHAVSRMHTCVCRACGHVSTYQDMRLRMIPFAAHIRVRFMPVARTIHTHTHVCIYVHMCVEGCADVSVCFDARRGHVA